MNIVQNLKLPSFDDLLADIGLGNRPPILAAEVVKSELAKAQQPGEFVKKQTHQPINYSWNGGNGSLNP